MAAPTSRIAIVTGTDSAAVNAVFAAAVATWRKAGARVTGVVAEGSGLANSVCSAGFLRDVTSGQAFQIYLDESPADTSCHLDAAGVNAACAAIIRDIPGCDLVVLSKFGKLEAMRQGLAAAFLAAFSAGKPVLTTVSGKHRDAWRAFAPDAVSLPAEDAALQQWWRGLQPH
jgi:hypothetical protein